MPRCLNNSCTTKTKRTYSDNVRRRAVSHLWSWNRRLSILLLWSMIALSTIFQRSSLPGEERIEIRIKKCVMTPDADPNYSTHHDLITDGCSSDDTVEYHDPPNGLAQRFSFQAFRFNERPTAVVYMHCYIDVCSVRLSIMWWSWFFEWPKVTRLIYDNSISITLQRIPHSMATISRRFVLCTVKIYP